MRMLINILTIIIVATLPILASANSTQPLAATIQAETKTVTETKAVVEPKAVVKTKTVAEVKAVESKPIAKTKTVTEAKAAVEPKAIAETKTVAETKAAVAPIKEELHAALVATQAVQPSLADEVLLPGSEVIAGNPDKNEFFIVAKDQPLPAALLAERKEAEDRIKPVQVALNEVKKAIDDIQAEPLEKSLSENISKKEVVASTLLKQSPEAVLAKNDMPSLNDKIALVAAADPVAPSVNAPKEIVREVKAETPKKLAKKTERKTVVGSQSLKSLANVTTTSKTSVKHVFIRKSEGQAKLATATTTIKPAMAGAQKTTKLSSADIKARLAEVEVIKMPVSAKKRSHGGHSSKTTT